VNQILLSKLKSLLYMAYAVARIRDMMAVQVWAVVVFTLFVKWKPNILSSVW